MKRLVRSISTGCSYVRRGSRRSERVQPGVFEQDEGAQTLLQCEQEVQMQNAKDSFYAELRARLVSINSERTILLRGAVRPGIIVEEAEGLFSQLPNDVFVL